MQRTKNCRKSNQINLLQNILEKKTELEVMSLKSSNVMKIIFKVDENNIRMIGRKDILGKLPTPEILITGVLLDSLIYKYIFKYSKTR